MSVLKRYWGTIRRLRVLHVLHNIRHYGKLKHNRALYDRFGIHRSVVAPLSHRVITQHTGESPWLDAPDAQARMHADERFSKFQTEIQRQLENFPDDGYMILRGFVAPEVCDKISSEIKCMIATKRVDFDYTNSRVMNAWRYSSAIRDVIRNPELISLLSFMMNRDVVPFQTISFLRGSQQRTHSDSIHMTTEPLGYLLAIWVALEDVDENCGPLHYYPGSHKLPYVLSENFEHRNNVFTIDGNYYGRYEDHIARMVEQKQLKKRVFTARKGDLLIWHANLLHGGEKVVDPGSTRKSLVAHYFCKGDVICYHEITQRPAIMPEE